MISQHLVIEYLKTSFEFFMWELLFRKYPWLRFCNLIKYRDSHATLVISFYTAFSCILVFTFISTFLSILKQLNSNIVRTCFLFFGCDLKLERKHIKNEHLADSVKFDVGEHGSGLDFFNWSAVLLVAKCNQHITFKFQAILCIIRWFFFCVDICNV